MRANSLIKNQHRYSKLLKDDIPFKQLSILSSIKTIELEIEKLENQLYFELLTPVVQLGAGKAFGEIALDIDPLHPQKMITRQATILCMEDCKFAIMTKKDYQDVLLKFQQKMTDNMIKFFHQIPLFSKIRRGILTRLHHSMEKRVCMRG